MTASITEFDNARRYVLPDDAPYLRNLAALWGVDPALAAQIEALPEEARYEVQQSKAGPPTVCVPAPQGRNLFLHSRYDPMDEARRLVEAADCAEAVAFYIHGLGLGYHLELLFDAAGDDAIFLVFEPDLLLLRTAFECRDFVRLIDSRRVMFIIEADKSDLLLRLTPHTALLSVGVASVIHPPSLQVAEAFHQEIQAWTQEYASFTRTSINTLVLNGRRTAENIARNIGWYAATPGLHRLRGRHRNEPAVIVSAGPSLRKNQHLLKGLDSSAVIVAVQTTLQPLLDMGVEPHYVTSLDYHDICTRFFEKLPSQVRTELVAEPKATSRIFSMFPGPLSLLGNDFAESLLREMRLEKDRLPGGATVAHLAFYLAEHLGCDPIIFIGQDLGFSDGLCYAPGTSYEDVWRPELSRFCSVEMKQWEQIARDRFILRRIPDQQGNSMYTEERLFTYLQQFERDFARSPARIIDATEGGAAKRGATKMSLAEAIATYCRNDLRPIPTDHPGPSFSRIEDAADCLARRRQEAGEIEEVSRLTLPLLEEIGEALENQGRVNQLIAQIDALRARMNHSGATYELVVQLTQNTEMKRFEADRRLSSGKLDPLEKQRRQVARDIENVRGVMEAAREFQQLMDEAMTHLRAGPTAAVGKIAEAA